ncbi:MAG: hypothetical protein ACYTG5_06470 [Planctomycetota bacterium]|jgi:hypothetical protein
MSGKPFEASDWDRDLDGRLEERLRQDAADWRAEPGAECLLRMRASLAELEEPRRSGSLPLLVAAAAVIVLGLSLWSLSVLVEGEPGAAVDSQSDEPVMVSLQQELDAVTADANAIAETLMEPFSGGIFSLIAQGEETSVEDR